MANPQIANDSGGQHATVLRQMVFIASKAGDFPWL
jgi:hypothetical protein